MKALRRQRRQCRILLGGYLLTTSWLITDTSLALVITHPVALFRYPSSAVAAKSPKLRQLQSFLSSNDNNSNNNSAENGDFFSDYLEFMLKENRFDRRLVTLSKNSDLPMLAEFQEQGQAQICSITDIVVDDKTKLPKVELQWKDGTSRMVDLGQITTIWQDSQKNTMVADDDSLIISQDHQIDISSFPVGHVDETLDRLYQTRIGRARESSLTKKKVAKLVAQCPPFADSNHVEQVLRQVVKTGNRYALLVDSATAMELLFEGDHPKLSKTKNHPQPQQQRAFAANALAQDARSGGRFKRMGCMYVSSSSTDNSITLINGGWLVLDQSVRAASEARKFAAQQQDSKSDDSTSPSTTTTTLADERIIHRLECLAMGDARSSSSSEDLELDVRETLKAMELPTTPQGAKDALIRIGRWSNNNNQSSQQSQQRVDPWSRSVLEAAEWYTTMDQERRRQLYEIVVQQTGGASNEFLEGRVDLTKLPCVCVDAARTSFRDDAIGVRPRASTGRTLNSEASKWEILLHIADVSDLYATSPDVVDVVVPNNNNNKEYLTVLGAAAASRGTSRYDLPLGPLHLLPPMVLQSLALETVNPDLSSAAPIRPQSGSINRCVTVWVYIDERTGKLLDVGVERTLISRPLALSFQSATALLDGSLESAEDPYLAKTKAILAVAERNLKLWSEYHRERNEAAKAREERLAARETVGQELYGNKRGRDDGQAGFQRTRGHRLVDACLDIYGYAMNGLLHRSKAYVPRVAGTGMDRLGRVATAPLRRYIDGMSQRQALAVLCKYGGLPLTKQECIEVGQRATKAINTISNLNSSKKGTTQNSMVSPQQRKAIRVLKSHIAQSNDNLVPAMSTGKQSEVIILGVGVVATCKGIKGTLKPGEKVMVRIKRVDEDSGKVSAMLVGPTD